MLIHFPRLRMDHGGAPAQDLYARHRQHALVDGIEARDLPVLVGEQGAPVEAWLSGGPAIGLRDLEFLAPVRGVGKELLRDAADVDAGAAEEVRLGDGDFAAAGGREAAGAHAAGAPSYGAKIVIEAYFRFFRLSSTSSSSVVLRACCGLSASHFRAFLTRCSICAFGMPSTPSNIYASSLRLLD